MVQHLYIYEQTNTIIIIIADSVVVGIIIITIRGVYKPFAFYMICCVYFVCWWRCCYAVECVRMYVRSNVPSIFFYFAYGIEI